MYLSSCVWNLCRDDSLLQYKNESNWTLLTPKKKSHKKQIDNCARRISKAAITRSSISRRTNNAIIAGRKAEDIVINNGKDSVVGTALLLVFDAPIQNFSSRCMVGTVHNR